MKRIDHLIGAIVTEIRVSRDGKIRLEFKQREGTGWSPDFNPLTVEIPKEPKKRKKKEETR